MPVGFDVIVVAAAMPAARRRRHPRGWAQRPPSSRFPLQRSAQCLAILPLAGSAKAISCAKSMRSTDSWEGLRTNPAFSSASSTARKARPCAAESTSRPQTLQPSDAGGDYGHRTSQRDRSRGRRYYPEKWPRRRNRHRLGRGDPLRRAGPDHRDFFARYDPYWREDLSCWAHGENPAIRLGERLQELVSAWAPQDWNAAAARW